MINPSLVKKVHCSADDDDSVAAADDIVARISSRMISFHGDYVLNLDERFDQALMMIS